MKKSATALVLALSMVLSLTACAGGTSATTKATTTAAAIEPATTTQTTTAATETTTTTAATITYDAKAELAKLEGAWTKKNTPITFSLASEVHDGTEGKIWAEDEITRLITDLTGVKLAVTFGSEKLGEAYSFYDVLSASGELPDLVYLETQSDVYRMAESGNAAALDELALQYCPDFWNDMDGSEILYNTSSDGHVYTLRSGYISDRYYDTEAYPISYPNPLVIRTDLLEKLGEEMPTSVEGLEQLLHKVKENMGELKILTPLVAPNIISFPVASWMGVDNAITRITGTTLKWDEENKKVITSMGDSDWYEYLMEMNRWHQDGLITLTEYDGDIRGELGPSTYTTGDSLISFARVPRASFVNAMTYTIRGQKKSVTEPLQPVEIVTEALTWQGEDQMAAVPVRNDHVGMNQSGLFISNTCHDKERAILFYEFLYSDYGAKLTHWGLEGVHYTLDEDGHVTMTEGNTRNEKEAAMHGLFDLELASDTLVGYWALVDNPMVRGQYAASPVGAEVNGDILRVREDLIEAGKNYKNKAAERTILPLEEALPMEGEPTYEEYRKIYRIWETGVNEMVCAETVELAEARWKQLQDELMQNGLRDLEQNLTHRFEEVLKRYQAAGYYTDIAN